MPVIKITQKDVARLNPPDPGIHLAELKEVNEAASKDKMSVNYQFQFEIVSPGQNEGRWISDNANSKAPLMTLGPMMSAMMSIGLDQIKVEDIDTDKLIGKRVGIEVIDDVYEGRIVKKIKSYIDPTKMTSPF